jgi:hypothetical protein
MKWGDGEELVVTSRTWTIIAWIVVILGLVLVLITSLNTTDPCEGKTGQDYQYCVDLNYP